jgi:hypothetical protein
MDWVIKAGHAPLVERLAGLDAAPLDPGGQVGLQGGHAAGVDRAREDANTKHEGIIP